MAESDDKHGATSARAAKAERLGAALRQNLRRRKDAVRSERRGDPKPRPAETGGNPPKGDERA
jgi:hypothetical protein